MSRARSLLDALGAAGVAGLGLLAFCAAFHGSTLLPAERALAARSAPLDARRADGAVRTVSAGDPAPQLARFHAAFPTAARLADQLDELHGLARAAGLSLLEAEYRWEAQGTGLAAYRVVLPVRGTYAQLRGFVGRLLERMPTASLDALRFERKRPSAARLEAQIRVTLYLRDAEVEGI